jgi:hypothetical protein
MVNWADFYTRQEQIKDLQREAEQERLAQEALASTPQHNHFYCHALMWLGGRLVAIGQALQSRHSDAGRSSQPLAGAHNS